MKKIIIAVFLDKNDVDSSLRSLIKKGFEVKDFSIIMKKLALHKESLIVGKVTDGAAAGIATGGVVGGLTGLLVGIGAVTLPGVGSLLVSGPIASLIGISGALGATASGAFTGILTGGFIGVLLGFGIPEDQARIYEEKIKAGSVVLLIPVSEDNENKALEILELNNAQQIRTIVLNDK